MSDSWGRGDASDNVEETRRSSKGGRDGGLSLEFVGFVVQLLGSS